MNTTVKIGDWISGTSHKDEKFIGYVESINAGGVLKAWVTQCDREHTVGTSVETTLSKVKKLPESIPSTKDELNSLIELSLQTHDQQWFEELSSKLAALSSSTTGSADTQFGYYNTRSRLIGLAPKDPMDV
ncbi:MAG: hypothetical protein K0R28_3188 [Paenibacillus sp.]|jgi:hypothetical protein|nr:hypothetical protein [Paenibacillus sp.]